MKAAVLEGFRDMESREEKQNKTMHPVGGALKTPSVTDFSSVKIPLTPEQERQAKVVEMFLKSSAARDYLKEALTAGAGDALPRKKG